MFAPDADDDPFEQLTDEQRQAAGHDGGHLLIVAGAGTGKTTTLAARLAHLVAAGVPAERIVLLTFSRRAAAELIGRAEAWAGAEALAGAWAGTFHAVGHRILSRWGAAAGLDRSTSLLDAADAADLLALVRDEVAPAGEPVRRRARKEVLAGALSRVVNTATPLPEVLAQHYPWCRDQEAEIRAAFLAYVARKRSRGLVDYDDLLVLWRAVLREPDLGASIASRFDHVLVDEFQDVNDLQVDILAALADGGATVTAVGDDAQAIYGFRGGSARHVLDFPDRFGADVVALTRNHRSTPEVVAVANRVWAAAAERHDKELVAVRPGGPRPVLRTAADEHAEVRAVCTQLLGAIDRGIPLRAQAVLFRTGHHADLLELELAARRIPFVKYGGLRFLEARHVKDLLALCRIAVNDRDDLAWFRILQRLDGVGPGRARRMVAALETAGGSPDALVAAGIAPHEAAERLDTLATAVRVGDGDTAGEVVARCRAWLAPTLERDRDAEARDADLARLAELAAATDDLSTFLADLTLDPPASTSGLAGPPTLDDDVLTLSTIHSAKGGEWDVVHLLHVADGNLPSDLATGDPAQLEEERRLLYVAVTRARTELHVHVPLRFHHHRHRRDDAHTIGLRSRFLTDDVVDAFDVVTVAPDRPVGAATDQPPRSGLLSAVDDELGLLLG